jgi:hypothetical protein
LRDIRLNAEDSRSVAEDSEIEDNQPSSLDPLCNIAFREEREERREMARRSPYISTSALVILALLGLTTNVRAATDPSPRNIMCENGRWLEGKTERGLSVCFVYKTPECLCTNAPEKCRKEKIYKKEFFLLFSFSAHETVHLREYEPCFVWTVHSPPTNFIRWLKTAVGILLALASFISLVYGCAVKSRKYLEPRNSREEFLNARQAGCPRG